MSQVLHHPPPDGGLIPNPVSNVLEFLFCCVLEDDNVVSTPHFSHH